MSNLPDSLKDPMKALEKGREILAEIKPIIMYRCGWCGWPCESDGACLEIDNDQAASYLKEHKDLPVECVNGACCPNGN